MALVNGSTGPIVDGEVSVTAGAVGQIAQDLQTQFNFAPDQKHNLVATVDPVASNNAAEGYAVRSLWKNTTTGEMWQLITLQGNGDAVWQQVTLERKDIVAGLTDGQVLRRVGTETGGASIFETSTNVVITKKISTKDKTVQLGEVVDLGAAGGDLIVHSRAGAVEDHFLLPKKNWSLANGTQGAFTLGRVIGAVTVDDVLQPLFALRSDDPSATTATNNVAGKIKFFTVGGAAGRLVSRVIFRAATAQTGIQAVFRHTNAAGHVVARLGGLEVEYGLGIGFTSLVYAGTPATETVIDLSESPILIEAGVTYHVTIESNTGPVVAFGGLITGNYIPYVRRDIASVVNDPVVARGEETITATQTFDALDWYETKYLNGTFSVRMPPLAASAGLDLRLVNIGTGTITVLDNAGAVTLGTIEANSSHVYESDGTAIRRVSSTSSAVAVGTTDLQNITETIAGIESRLDIVESADELDDSSENAIYAAIASIVSRLDSLRTDDLRAVQAGLSSLVARMESLRIPGIGQLYAAVGSLAARIEQLDAALEVERQVRDSGDSAITETVAGIEARLRALETTGDLDDSSEDAIYAAIASLSSQLAVVGQSVNVADRAAIASIVARLDALDIPSVAPIFAAMASLHSRVEDLSIPTIEPLRAATASIRSEQDVHAKDISLGRADRIALAETIAGVESRLEDIEDNDEAGEAALSAAVASLRAQLDALRLPDTDGLVAAVASLEARIEALRIPTDSGVVAGVASIRSEQDVQGKDISQGRSDRIALAETVAGVEARLDELEDNDEAGESALVAAVSSLRSQVDAQRIPLDTGIVAGVASIRSEQDEHDNALALALEDRQSITETIAGVEASVTQTILRVLQAKWAVMATRLAQHAIHGDALRPVTFLAQSVASGARQTITSESFQGSTHTFTISGPAAGWVHGIPGAGDPGVGRARILKTGALGVNYTDNIAGARALSPSFTIVANALCTFSLSVAGSTEASFDFVRVRLVVGASETLTTITRQTGGTTNRVGDHLHGDMGTASLARIEYDFPAAASTRVAQVALDFTSDGSVTQRGYGFSDIVVDAAAASGTFTTGSIILPSAPGRFILLADEDPGTGTITYEVSRNGGTNYQTVTAASLQSLLTVSGTRRIIATQAVDFTSTSGTTLIVRATITGNARLFGIAAEGL